ncbi:MAG: TSUP family transporter [Vulcanococcus sp.]
MEGALAIGFAIIAVLYSSVGHAGASGYIALMALAGLQPELVKPVALLLNCVVASISCWNFLGAGLLPWRSIWPVYLLAVPAAFLGGWLHLPAVWFHRLVGLVLLLSALRLACGAEDPASLRRPSGPLLAITGGGLGLLAGLTGTGGGVFLTPLLLLARWCHTRQAAATSALFILVNSISGLAGPGPPSCLQLSSECPASVGLWLFCSAEGLDPGWAAGIGQWLGSGGFWPWCWCLLPAGLCCRSAAWNQLGLPGICWVANTSTTPPLKAEVRGWKACKLPLRG